MRPRQATYMAVVGALLWLASFTRPDLTHAASVLARFVSNPAHAHFVAMQRVLTYLHNTRDLGLRFAPHVAKGLEVYTDADSGRRIACEAGQVASCQLVVWPHRATRCVQEGLSRGGYPGGERERCHARGHSGVPRTNRGTDEVRSTVGAVTPRPWDHSGALARLWLESLVRPRTRLKRCRAWLPLRCWCGTVVCSMLDNRVLPREGEYEELAF